MNEYFPPGEWGLYLSTRVWSQAHWQRLQTLQTGLYRNLQREGRELLGIQGVTAR